MQEQETTMKKLDRFPIECRETKPNYQLDFSANLKPYSKTKTKAITRLFSKLSWKPVWLLLYNLFFNEYATGFVFQVCWYDMTCS